ncbi:hypothetical protein Tco_0681614 [Tanacetum coccineum]|uniref:Uncharacterized protein n=1 Tax=Tanacetum coccineum TaxID=301880 RepID=A0ABQ4XP01_9ASTR
MDYIKPLSMVDEDILSTYSTMKMDLEKGTIDMRLCSSRRTKVISLLLQVYAMTSSYGSTKKSSRQHSTPKKTLTRHMTKDEEADDVRDSPFNLDAVFPDSDYSGELALDRSSHKDDISDEFGVKTGICEVNAAKQELVLLGKKLVLLVKVSTAGLPLELQLLSEILGL